MIQCIQTAKFYGADNVSPTPSRVQNMCLLIVIVSRCQVKQSKARILLARQLKVRGILGDFYFFIMCEVSGTQRSSVLYPTSAVAVFL